MPVAHIGLSVTDLARSISFYRDVFGLIPVRESAEDGRRYAFLGNGERVVLTLWQQGAGGFAKDRAGLHHLAFEVPSLADVRAAQAQLHTLGVRFAYDGVVAQSEGAPSGGIYFEDPDGIRLEIYTRTGAESLTAPVSNAPTCGFF